MEVRIVNVSDIARCSMGSLRAEHYRDNGDCECRAKPEDAGCWIDGHWGQYGTARLVDLAESHGYGKLPGMAEVIDLAKRKMMAMMPSDSPELSDDEEERLCDADDEVVDWLNFNVAPKGYSFGWHDGEFFLWSEYDWNEPEMGYWE